MAGTQTTTLVEGDPEVEEGIAQENINVGDFLQHKAGSVGSLEQVDTGGTLHQVMVAAESGSVEVDGSYPSSEIVKYYIGDTGNKFYAKLCTDAADGATGTIQESDQLGLSANAPGALGGTDVGGAGVPNARLVDGTVGTASTGTKVVKRVTEVL